MPTQTGERRAKRGLGRQPGDHVPLGEGIPTPRRCVSQPCAAGPVSARLSRGLGQAHPSVVDTHDLRRPPLYPPLPHPNLQYVYTLEVAGRWIPRPTVAAKAARRLASLGAPSPSSTQIVAATRIPTVVAGPRPCWEAVEGHPPPPPSPPRNIEDAAVCACGEGVARRKAPLRPQRRFPIPVPTAVSTRCACSLCSRRTAIAHWREGKGGRAMGTPPSRCVTPREISHMRCTQERLRLR